MSSINFLGAASGLPLDQLVSTFVDVERKTKMARIEKTKSTLNASLSGVGQLRSALSGFLDAAKKLSGESLKARTISITQPEEGKTFIQATAKNTASAASFDVKVNQLAKGSRIESADNLFSSADAVVSTTDGELTFEAGDKSFTVAVTAGMTLNQLRLRINESGENFGVNANILNAGGTTGTKLVLTSNVTGQGNDLVIRNNNTELDNVSTEPTGATPGLALAAAAQDAIIELDGIAISSATNTFEDAVQDISITVVNETPSGKNARLQVATDKKAAEDNIQAFIRSYNALVDQIGTLTRNRIMGADGSVTLDSGALAGDSLPRNILNQVRGILGAEVVGAPDQLNSLFALGITLNKSGKLEISTSTEFSSETGKMRFDKALTENYDDLAKLFGGDNGLVKQLDSLITEYTKSGGLIANRQENLQLRLRENTKASEAASRYIASYEDSLRKRYAALDSLLGQMQRQQASVTAALSSLPSLNTKKSS
ncbi:flagellar filament capping protein FliD [Alishewanella jeotgali]|uniref:Flagellar hook-associated protein 2 n=1 Tax=Alishewanella jeotgali KCTC 22429 TaxID=1129374 RepID=H3ZBK5_9ALTE|nr:flagellar filament capping protein FliD [Alishewanella jeotgali]EHR42319.1 flagellar capping protein [Alishewanella jeotgali KCTC 22429]